jgi:hypothetical protein
MAHIRYGDRNYHIQDSDIEEYQQKILEALRKNEVTALGVSELINGQRYPSTLFISRGVPLSVHEWDTHRI